MRCVATPGEPRSSGWVGAILADSLVNEDPSIAKRRRTSLATKSGYQDPTTEDEANLRTTQSVVAQSCHVEGSSQIVLPSTASSIPPINSRPYRRPTYSVLQDDEAAQRLETCCEACQRMLYGALENGRQNKPSTKSAIQFFGQAMPYVPAAMACSAEVIKF